MPSFTVPTQKIAPGTLPGPRITPEHVAPMQGLRDANKAIQGVGTQFIARQRKAADMFDENRVAEEMNLSREQISGFMIGGDDPLYFRKGSNAFGSAAEGSTRMDEVREQALERLNNQRQRDEFIKRWPRVSLPWSDRLMNNESRQGDVYTESVFASEEEWIVRGDSPPEQAGADARNLAEKKARFYGTEEDTFVDTETQKITEARHLEKFNSLVVSGHPVEALDYYDRYENEFGKNGRQQVAKNKESLFQEAAKQEVRDKANAARKNKQSGGEEARIAADDIVNDNTRSAARDFYIMPDGARIDFRRPAEEWDLNRSAIMRQFGVDDSTLIYAFINSGENPGFGDLADPDRAVDRLAKGINNHAMSFNENPHLTIAAVRYGESAVTAALEASKGSKNWEDIVKHLPEGAGAFVDEILNTATSREPVDKQAQGAREDGALNEASRQAQITSREEINAGTRLYTKRVNAVLGDLRTDVPKFKAMDPDEIKEQYEPEVGSDGVAVILKEQSLLYKDQNYANAEKIITRTMEAAAYFRPTKKEVLEAVGGKAAKDREKYDEIKESILAEIKATVAKNNGRPMSEGEIKFLVDEKLIKNRQYIEEGVFSDTIHNFSEIDIMRGLNARMPMRPATTKEKDDAKAALQRAGEELTWENLVDEVEAERNYKRDQGIPQ